MELRALHLDFLHESFATGASATAYDRADIDSLMEGAIDLHCHSGPSVMDRHCDHMEAMREASDAGLQAVLLKDHYYSATPVTHLLNKHFSELGVLMLSRVPLNNAVGGINVHAVEHGIKIGAQLVWMPTFRRRTTSIAIGRTNNYLEVPPDHTEDAGADSAVRAGR